MNVLLRRMSVHVRRDAAQRLSNGRILYDALFTRTGYQDYRRADGSISVEYRPPAEVFRPDSLASLANLPGVVLHPAANFGTKFDGRYPVKGCTGSSVVEHTDHIHTAGTLCVWDDDWNADIDSGEIGQLSCGYELTPGPGGVGPDGKRYDLMHTAIIGDHMAGVPLGRAGSARVVLDSVPRATRAALAEIAAARMDARPLYHDLGRWLQSETQDTTNMKRIITKIDGKDVVVEVADNATHEQVAEAVCKEYVKADAARKAEHDRALEAARAEGKRDAEMLFGKKPKPEEEEEDAKKKADALARQKADAAAMEQRFDALATARAVLGLDYKSDGKDATAIKLDVIEHVLGKDERKDVEGDPGAVGFIYRRALTKAAADRREDHGATLLREIQAASGGRTDAKPREGGGPITKTRTDAEEQAALPRHERAAAKKAG